MQLLTNSWALLRAADSSQIRIRQRSELHVLPATPASPGWIGWLQQGILYLLHRDEPGRFQFQTRTVTLGIHGTEFNLAAGEDGGTVLTLIDGEVDFGSRAGSLRIRSGERAVAEPGRPPERRAFQQHGQVSEPAKVQRWLALR